MSDSARSRQNKQVLLDRNLLKQARKVLGTRTATETIEIALKRVIIEAKKDKQAFAAHNEFLKSAVTENLIVEDVFGHLDDK